jgi:hypothetical protein
MGTVIDPRELTRYLLQNAFNIRNPDKLLLAPEQAMPMGPEGDPMAAEAEMAAGEPPVEEEMPADIFGGTDAVPPAQAQQLAGQVGLMTNMMGMGR